MSGLTQEQQQQFLTQGYLILSQAIPSHLVEYLAGIAWNRLLSECKGQPDDVSSREKTPRMLD
tara:strand:+ start:638 stop:826 length:189 start_codon:yes stop_codon:yes gene_type:complete